MPSRCILTPVISDITGCRTVKRCAMSFSHLRDGKILIVLLLLYNPGALCCLFLAEASINLPQASPPFLLY